MKSYQKKANENFFDKVLLSLNNGGKYAWIEKHHIYSKFHNKLYAHTQIGYDDIRNIVTPKWFDQKIRIIDNNKKDL
jgi:hypothetical protein